MSTLTDVRIPFDERLLDELLAEAGIDALLVTCLLYTSRCV